MTLLPNEELERLRTDRSYSAAEKAALFSHLDTLTEINAGLKAEISAFGGLTHATKRIEAVAAKLEGLSSPGVPEEPQPPSPPPETPEIPPAEVAPHVVELFYYADTAALHASSKYFDQRKNIERVVLDPTGGLTGGPAMRYDFPDRTAEGGSGTSGRCTDYSISRGVLTVPSGTKELWAEVWSRFSENWTVRAPAAWGCTSNPDYKFLFGGISPGSDGKWGRFGLDLQPGQWIVQHPADTEISVRTAPLPPEAVWDGKWHRYRVHFKVNSSESVPDGAMAFWVDDRLLYARKDINIPRSELRGIQLGANINQGPGHAQYLWHGQAAIWLQNPGW